MKLLVCAYEYFPYGSGIANVAYNVVRELEKKGVDCTVCSPTGPDIKLGSRKLIAKGGIIGFLDYWLKVSKLDMSKYDAVWLNNPLSLRKIYHKNCVVTVHTTYSFLAKAGFSPNPYYRMCAAIEHYCLNKFDRKTKFVCINEGIRGDVSDIGIGKENIRLIPNGVFIKRFQIKRDKNKFRKKLGLPKDKKIILSVGRLTEQKLPYKQMEFFSMIEKARSDFYMVVGGKGELLESVKRKAKELGIKNITFLGYVPEENLPRLYLSADYFILLSKYEALPLTLLDSMACGLPSMVTDIPGMQVVKTDKCGIIIETNHLRKGVNDFIKMDAKMYPLFSKNAKIAAKRYDWSNIAKAYLEVLESNRA